MSGRLVEGFETVLVLGGGNALGAYHLGVCEALLARDEPARILGCSIGAAMGAILLGNAPEQRIERMREFWAAVALRDEPWTRFMPEQVRARWSNGVGLSAILQGRRGVSAPRFPGWLSLLPLMPPDVSVQDHKPMGQLLDRLVDWGRVNDSPIGFAFPAIDIERGEVVWWDNRTTRIEARHILATTAFRRSCRPWRSTGGSSGTGGWGRTCRCGAPSRTRRGRWSAWPRTFMRPSGTRRGASTARSPGRRTWASRSRRACMWRAWCGSARS
jgi:predicted acylesterase/phospholipase RssA